jgi:hypothetical protein
MAGRSSGVEVAEGALVMDDASWGMAKTPAARARMATVYFILLV